MHDGEDHAVFDADAIRSLPFVDETHEGVSFWNAEASGHQDADIDLGDRYGRLALEVAKRLDMPELVAMVLRDIILGGKFTAVEAGFLGVVAKVARVGSMN